MPIQPFDPIQNMNADEEEVEKEIDHANKLLEGKTPQDDSF